MMSTLPSPSVTGGVERSTAENHRRAAIAAVIAKATRALAP
jgi:hypothetical protein